MLDRGRIHQGHVREIRDVSTCTAQHVGAATRSIWRDVTLPLRKKKTYPLQTCYEHNMLSLLHAVCLKVLVFFLCFYDITLLSLRNSRTATGSSFSDFINILEQWHIILSELFSQESTGCCFEWTASMQWGTQWRSWVRHCATSQKVAGSIPDGVIGIFH